MSRTAAELAVEKLGAGRDDTAGVDVEKDVAVG